MPAKTTAVVTVYIFSGRSNPQWKLTPGQQAKWNRYWSNAISSDEAAAPASRLGYTGCRLQINKDRYWYVYNGYVSLYEKDKITSKSDEGRMMEKFLLQTADEKTGKLLKDLKVV